MTQETQTTGREITPAADRPKTVQEMLLSKPMQDQLRLALPKHITPERLSRIVLTQIRRVPELLDCTRDSLFGAIMECAQLGLEPGVLGQAWIIPYKDRKHGITIATLIIGYRGMVALAWRSSQIKSIQARAVYKDDTFVYGFGLEPRILHVPNPEVDPDPKNLTHVYAVIQTRGGGTLYDVMTWREVEAVRARSKASDSGPWSTDYAEMAKKTVLRRLLKLAPISVEMQHAMALEEAQDQGDPQAFATLDVDVLPPSEHTPENAAQMTGLREKLETRKGAAGEVVDAPEGTVSPWSNATPQKCIECQVLRSKVESHGHAETCSMAGEK